MARAHKLSYIYSMANHNDLTFRLILITKMEIVNDSVDEMIGQPMNYEQWVEYVSQNGSWVKFVSIYEFELHYRLEINH